MVLTLSLDYFFVKKKKYLTLFFINTIRGYRSYRTPTVLKLQGSTVAPLPYLYVKEEFVMNKEDLVKTVSDDIGVVQTETAIIVDAVLKGIYKGILNNEKVSTI